MAGWLDCVIDSSIFDSLMSFATIVLVTTAAAIIVVQIATATDHAIPSSPNTNSTIQDIVNLIEGWKQEYDETTHDAVGSRRPFVTLTFAQSLDGRIALKSTNSGTSSNLKLSGDDSWRMSHALRSIHDAVLIGGQTFTIDNPRLTNRLWPPFLKQPRPVILDTHLTHFRKFLEDTTYSTDRLCVNVRCHRPIFCCCEEAAASLRNEDGSSKLFEEAAFELLTCGIDTNRRLNLRDLLQTLFRRFGVRSIMVEGGASVLSSFVRSRDLVDCICVTITPTLVGDDRGLPPFASIGTETKEKEHDELLVLTCESRFLQLGKDCAFLSRWPRKIDTSSY